MGPWAQGPRVGGRTDGRAGGRADGRADGKTLKVVKLKKTRSEIPFKKTCLTAPHHFLRLLGGKKTLFLRIASNLRIESDFEAYIESKHFLEIKVIFESNRIVSSTSLFTWAQGPWAHGTRSRGPLVPPKVYHHHFSCCKQTRFQHFFESIFHKTPGSRVQTKHDCKWIT